MHDKLEFQSDVGFAAEAKNKQRLSNDFQNFSKRDNLGILFNLNILEMSDKKSIKSENNDEKN